MNNKAVNLSSLCYRSISVAIALPGSHDRILMGRFSPVIVIPSVPAHTLSTLSRPAHPCFLCRTKSRSPWWRGAVWLSVNRPTVPLPSRPQSSDVGKRVKIHLKKNKQKDAILLFCVRKLLTQVSGCHAFCLHQHFPLGSTLEKELPVAGRR